SHSAGPRMTLTGRVGLPGGGSRGASRRGSIGAPGNSTITLTPVPLGSCAPIPEAASTNALLGPYGEPPAPPPGRWLVDRLMILPKPRASMLGTIAWLIRNTPFALVSTIPSQASTSAFQNGGTGRSFASVLAATVGIGIAALLNSTSILPKASTAS